MEWGAIEEFYLIFILFAEFVIFTFFLSFSPLHLTYITQKAFFFFLFLFPLVHP